MQRKVLEEAELFGTFQDFKARIHAWAAVAGFSVREPPFSDLAPVHFMPSDLRLLTVVEVYRSNFPP
jgi:hypothetical protein